ncbi:hypothetical protein LCGC14_0354740 [marine sediment metagenome]|uniref:Uncharacterized protein n=1 Tax=marine sediment metagenome TaxID=412755 RepID=A0A0F9TF85_9ZZZZ
MDGLGFDPSAVEAVGWTGCFRILSRPSPAATMKGLR